MIQTEGKDTALVIFQPSGRRGLFPLGMPILQAARQLGVYLESVCGGRGLCGRCQIDVGNGHFPKYGISSSPENLSPAGTLEVRYRKDKQLADERRLGCSALIEGDLVIEIPDESQTNRQIVRKRAESRIIKRDLCTRLCYVELSPPDISSPSGDASRLIAALEEDWPYQSLSLDPALLPGLQSTLRNGDWSVTAAVFHEKEGLPIVTGLWPRLKENIFGLSIDIGSTTIAVHLSDFRTGRVVASAGGLNPQIRFGEDLMSRISFIQMNPGSQSDLTDAVRETVDTLIVKTASEASTETDDILEAVVVGNPIMHHLFLGIDPAELGGAPFALALSSALTMPASEVISVIPKTARLHVLPCVAGHVGADASAMILSERPYATKFTTLLVDVGTNAEIVLGNKDRVLAASSPTGPAFEGAEISCGQRAAPGAIERVRIDPGTYEPTFKIIGVNKWSNHSTFEKDAQLTGITGICGSGIVEVIAEMYLAGLVSSDGVINPPPLGPTNRIEKSGRTYKYVIHRGSTEISVSQKDVRAIQLAKAALYAGVRLLMDKLGIDEIARIKLAGAFGSYIDPKYAMVLGLIPDCDLKKVSSVGNAASTGARMALINRSYRREIQLQVTKLEKVETALETRFQEHFVNAMAFPNKIDPFFQLRSQVSLPAPSSEKPIRRGRHARKQRIQ